MRFLTTLLLVAIVACLAGCGSTASNGVDIDKALRPLLPADTKALAGVDLDKLKESPLYQRHEKDLQLPMMEGASERFGIDPRRDISNALIAWDGKNALFLVRGRFKPAEVKQKLGSLGAPRTTYKNHQIFGDQKNSAAFLENGLAVLGSAAEVQRTIDLQGSGADTLPEELRDMLRQVPKSDQIWIVSRGGLPFADLPMRSDVESALSNIVNFITGATVGVKADTGVHFRIDLTCVSEQGAQRVHDALRGAIGLGRLSTKDNERELLQVYDAIGVDLDKDLVHVHADYPAELTDKLFEELGQMRKGLQR